MPTILIGGYYGAGNTGDEAILSQILAGFRRKRQDFDFIVISSNPEKTAHTHDVKSVLYSDIPALVEATKLCDLFILGGGGLFHDYYIANEKHLLTQTHISLSFYGTVLILAKLFNKPVMLYAVGVGPLFYESGINLTRLCFENANQVTVRDKGSLDLIKEIGISTNNVTLTADPAFLLAADSEKAKKIIDSLLVKERQLVGLCMRNWNIGVSAEKWQLEVAKALDLFAEKYDVNFLFIPFQISSEHFLTDDQIVAKNIVSYMHYRDRGFVLHEVFSPKIISGLIAECQILVGMRLHSLILAATAHVPFAGIIYDPKVGHILKRFELSEFGIDITKLEKNTLLEILERLWINKEIIHQSLVKKSEDLRILSQRNIEIALKLVDEQPDTTTRSAQLEKYIEDLLVQQSVSRFYLENQLKNKNDTIKELNAIILKKNHAIGQLSLQNQQLSSNLVEIQSSKAWSLMMFLRKVRYWLLPAGSFRESMVRIAWRLLKKINQYLKHFSLVRFRDRLLRSISNLIKKTTNCFKQIPGILTYSWEAYYFLRFKLNRKAIYSSNLKRLRTPNIPDMVSIVLPVYNGADFVCEAIDSILAQTYTNFQLILVNDGSTDDSPEILNNYAAQDTRIHVIHQSNQRLPKALNNGFKKAKGEFLTWTSADNRWYPDFLERMVACLKRHPKWDAEYGNKIIIDKEGKQLINFPVYEDYQVPKGSGLIHLPKNLCKLNVISHNYIGAAFLYRNSVDYLIGDYSPFRFCMEDYDFWMRVNSLLTLRHSDFLEPVYAYRFHSKSLTSRSNELGFKRNQEQLMVFEDARRDFYNMPMLWLIKTDGTAQSVSKERRISTRIERLGHYLLKPDEFNLNKISRLWAPLVAVMITTSPTDAMPDPQWPKNAYKVLLHVGNQALAESVDSSWDLCITFSKQQLPRLLKPRQGWLRVTDMATLFTTLDIIEKSRQTAFVENEIFDPPPAKVKLTVVICTGHRRESLIDSIQSVAKQTFPKEGYEVLIINNNPQDTAVSEIVEEIRAKYFSEYPRNIKLIPCPYKGLSNARNAGISEASGEILCFLGVDAVANEDWLEQIWRTFAENPQVGVVGGTIELNMPSPQPDWLTPDMKDLWGFFQIDYMDYTEVYDWHAFPYGANWCARRCALLEIGGFRSHYGRRDDDLGQGEQILVAILVNRLGYTVALAPQAKVMHMIDSSCLTLDHVRKTILASERTWYRLQTDLYIPNELSMKTILKRIKQKRSRYKNDKSERTKYELQAEYHVLLWFIRDSLLRFLKLFVAC